MIGAEPPSGVIAEDHRLALELPWLSAARAHFLRMLREERLPHGLLVEGGPGLGKAAFGDWAARLVLCDERGDAPCGRCASCLLHAAGNHPDLIRIGVAADRKQIAIDDVRELLGQLTLTSLRGGWKVAVVSPADALNANGANALLKTLEEPAPGTLLMLLAARPERLPRTIVSRCQRLRIPPPPTAVALAWLTARSPGDWSELLELAAGGPLGALALDRTGGRELIAEMAALVAGLAGPEEPDVVFMAERAARDHPFERLRYLEHWTTGAIRASLGVAPLGTATQPLPVGRLRRHIGGLYALLDDTRRAEGLMARGAANVQLLFEGVLLQLAALFRTSGRGAVEGKS